jgi:uncharacterized short protein YbdD (DUF466 family)
MRGSHESRLVSREPHTHDSRLTTLLRTVARVIRTIAGMPDYRAYVEHHHRCHPGQPPLGEREFFADYLRARYADGPNRCC